jgi:hypothetical protein
MPFKGQLQNPGRFCVLAIALAVAGCISRSTPYSHHSPVATSTGCPRIVGDYRYMPIARTDPPHFTPEETFLNKLYFMPSIPIGSLEDRPPEPKPGVEFFLSIIGDVEREIAVTVGPKGSRPIRGWKLNRANGDYTCSRGRLTLREQAGGGTNHGIAYSRSGQVSLMLATDGALVGYAKEVRVAIIMVGAIDETWATFPRTSADK